MNSRGIQWNDGDAKGNRAFGAKGEKATNVKLTTAEVLEIKRRLLRGEQQQNHMAKEFGVTPVTINAIKKGRIWFHVRLSDEERDAIEEEVGRR